MRAIWLGPLSSVAFMLNWSEARAEWVISLYSGVSHTRQCDLRIIQNGSGTDATFEDVSWAGRPFEDAPYYGLSIAWFGSPASHFGTSFDFTHYKMYAQTNRVTTVRGRWNGAPVNETGPLSDRVKALEISHGVNLGALNVQYRWKHSQTDSLGWAPYVRAGVVGYWPHAEGVVDGDSVGADYRRAGGGAQLFAGGEYRLSPRIGESSPKVRGLTQAGFDLVPTTHPVRHALSIWMDEPREVGCAQQCFESSSILMRTC